MNYVYKVVQFRQQVSTNWCWQNSLSWMYTACKKTWLPHGKWVFCWCL